MNLAFVIDRLLHNMAGEKALAFDACFKALRQLSDVAFHNAGLNTSNLITRLYIVATSEHRRPCFQHHTWTAFVLFERGAETPHRIV